MLHCLISFTIWPLMPEVRGPVGSWRKKSFQCISVSTKQVKSLNTSAVLLISSSFWISPSLLQYGIWTFQRVEMSTFWAHWHTKERIRIRLKLTCQTRLAFYSVCWIIVSPSTLKTIMWFFIKDKPVPSMFFNLWRNLARILLN